MISPNHNIDRSRVNEEMVNAPRFPKSGFDLSHKSFNNYRLGQLHVSGHHPIMPADRFSGSNQASLTFENMIVPNCSDVAVCQHNFFVTLRSIDQSFESNFAPSALNDMSAGWSAPKFSLMKALSSIIDYLACETELKTFISDLSTTVASADITNLTALRTAIQNTTIEAKFTKQYMHDWFLEYSKFLDQEFARVSVGDAHDDAMLIVLTALFQPWIGKNSLLDDLGYIYLRTIDFMALAASTDWSTFINMPSGVYQNEYALRAYYAVWYEYYRDTNLEPRRNTLLDWHSFGSSSLITNSYPIILLKRYRSWYKDVFVSSMPDDISRHVFAPIIESTSEQGVVTKLSGSGDYLNAVDDSTVGRNLSTFKFQFTDPVTGALTTVKTPVPKNINDSLVSSDSDLTAMKLDLQNLRNAHNLERYLKRNFYFGDEYKDRMLAHYGSIVSDMRINRPHFLSSSVSPINPNQVVNSTPTSEGVAGQRTMTVTASTDNDAYEYFAEEFGIVLNIISIMPKAQYAGTDGFHMLDKQTDFPLPEFAAHNEEYGRILEIAFSGIDGSSIGLYDTFGHYPYAHIWRARVNEVHGDYLDDKIDYTFRRFYSADTALTIPKLNHEFIHCKPNLDMFDAAHSGLFTTQVYGPVNHQFFVERVLPTPIETI